MNEITNTTIKKKYIPRQQNKRENFKNILDNHESFSKNFLTSNGNKNNKEDQNLNKADIEGSDKSIQSRDTNKTKKKPSKELLGTDKSTEEKSQIFDMLQKLNNHVEDVKGNLNDKNTVESKTIVESNPIMDIKPTKNLNSSNANNNLEAKIIDFVEVAINALNQNTGETSKQTVGNNQATEKVAQIQQVLQSLGFILQSVEKATTTENGKNNLNSINLEQLVGVEKLAPEAKGILKNNLAEIVDMLGKPKVNNGSSPKILEEIQKLTTQVEDEKGDLSLLKVANDKTTMESSPIMDIKPTQSLKSSNVNNNLEQLVGVEKLAPEAKNMIKSSLNEVFNFIEKSKGNTSSFTQ